MARPFVPDIVDSFIMSNRAKLWEGFTLYEISTGELDIVQKIN
jgi:hypothetical protein